jgi:co-chaperonin GroES (HSP10)
MRDRQQEAIVVAVGLDPVIDTPEGEKQVVPHCIDEGDHVFINKHAGVVVTHNDERLRLVAWQDVLAVVEPDPSPL